VNDDEKESEVGNPLVASRQKGPHLSPCEFARCGEEAR
jgi:hypothetical protein